MNRHLEFLISDAMPGSLAPPHVADLQKSGLTDETSREHRLRSVPLAMIGPLLGFPALKVEHAYVIPFPDPRDGWLDHVRLKVFPSIVTDAGTIKYLQRRRSGVRIFFPLATLRAVLRSTDPLYLVEGEKKALAVAQTGLPTVGVCGIEGWHIAGTRELHPDLDDIGLADRTVYVVPDGDWKTNPHVARAVRDLGAALQRRGAEARQLLVPEGFNGIDDWLVATA